MKTPLTIVGNLTADPELRFVPSGAAVANFTVAVTPRGFDKQKNEWVDGEAAFWRCTVWREAAENVAESLHRGDRVIVTGEIEARSYETKEGEKRTVLELKVEEVGPALRYATAQVTKAGRGGAGGQQQSRPAPAAQPQAASGWGGPQQAPAPARTGSSVLDEPPF